MAAIAPLGESIAQLEEKLKSKNESWLKEVAEQQKRPRKIEPHSTKPLVPVCPWHPGMAEAFVLGDGNEVNEKRLKEWGYRVTNLKGERLSWRNLPQNHSIDLIVADKALNRTPPLEFIPWLKAIHKSLTDDGEFHLTFLMGPRNGKGVWELFETELIKGVLIKLGFKIEGMVLPYFDEISVWYVLKKATGS